MHLRINHPSVISESIDGEVVIIALGTGTYYSLRGTGARAWDGLAAGRSTDAVTADLARAFAIPADVDAASAVEAFVTSLLAEGLVVEVADPEPGRPALRRVRRPTTEAAPWEPLGLETFTDMQELILLDPVHEVEPDQGWPVAIENPDR